LRIEDFHILGVFLEELASRFVGLADLSCQVQDGLRDSLFVGRGFHHNLLGLGQYIKGKIVSTLARGVGNGIES